MPDSSCSYFAAAKWDRETLRLQALEHHFDPGTIRLLTALGIGAGWRCLEVGAGAGSIARWLSTAVGPTGTVVATDVDIHHMAGQEMDSIRVLQHDITGADLDEGEFDLIHARTVLEHLPERQRIVDYLASLLAPGGTLLLEDSDLSPTWLVACGQYANSADAAARTARLLAAGAHLMAAAGADPYYGPKLGEALDTAGLREIAMELRINTAPGGSDSVLSLSFERLRGAVVAAELLNQAQCDAVFADLADPRLRLPGVPMVAASGKRASNSQTGVSARPGAR